jgi:hypothetical protein
MNKITKGLTAYERMKAYKAIFYDSFASNYSFAQKELSKLMYQSNFFITLSSRRTGKSFVFASDMIDYGLNWCGAGDQMLILGNSENNVLNLIVEGALLEPFGGKLYLSSVNQVYLRTDLDVVKKSMDQKVRFWETASGQEELQTWLEEGWITSDLSYVKLFIGTGGLTNSGSKEQSRYEGMLFNGVRIKVAGGNNPNVGSILSGQAYRVVWLEEIGQLDKNIFGVFIPTVLDRTDEFGLPNGKVLVNGTPSRDESNTWFYTDFVKPLLKGKGIEYQEKLGLEIYTDTRDIKGTQVLGGYSVSFKKTSVLAIGDFENVFPYVFGGITTFNSVQAARHVPTVGEAFYAEKLPKQAVAQSEGEEPTVYTSSYPERSLNLQTLRYEFKEKSFMHYKYDLVPASWADEKAGAGGEISFEDYSKEYRMQFNSMETKAFRKFVKANNVIPRDSFNPFQYNSVAGFDLGKGENVEFDINKEIKESGTCWAKVAIVPHADTYQYVIYETGYLPVPNNASIAKAFLELWEAGCPVIPDDSFFRSLVGGGCEYDWFLHQQPEVREHRLFGYKKSIYPCYKRKRAAVDKVKLFDDMFGKSRIGNTEVEYTGFTDKKGRQILITDNCVELIEYLTTLKINRKTSQLEKKRDDLYDAATYAIDFIEMKVAMDNLRTFWDEWAYFKNYPQSVSAEQSYGITLDSFDFF